MSAKPLICFLLFTVGFLLLFSPIIITAQSTSPKCEKGYIYDYVYDQVYEPETEPIYNTANNAWETRTVWRYKWRWIWKCVPIPPKDNLTTSKEEKTNSSNSKTVRNAEIKSNLGFRPPYAGQYMGKWNTTYSDIKGQKGEWTLFIDKNGKITGEEVNATFDVRGNIVGVVNENGYIELSIKYGGVFKDAPPAVIRGKITNTENRHLKGTLNQYDGDRITTTIEIDLAPTEAK